MNITLDASDFAHLADYWAKAPDITRTRLMQAMTASDALLQATLKQELPRGAGGAAGLAGSIATEEHALDDAVIGMVTTPKDYAQYVEVGTRPHAPPVQPLIDWVKVKLGLLDKSARSAAFAIRNAIAKRGTKPNPVWQRTWREKQAQVREYFDAAMAAIARDLMETNS